MNSICMSFDDAYLIPALITLKSLKSNAAESFDLTLINMNSSLSLKNESLLSKWCKLNGLRLTIIPVNVKATHFHTDQRISLSAYGRIYAISILNDPFIYLDSDVLGFAKWDSIFIELNSLVLNNNLIFASLESNSQSQTSSNWARRLAGEKYFSSGVLGVNPTQIDSKSFMAKVLELTSRYKENHFWAHDQDLLNYIFCQKVIIASPVYNSNIWKNTNAKPRILHFDGFFKPWKLSGLALVVTLVIAFGYDLRDILRSGSIFLRSRGFINHKIFERTIRSEIRIILGHQSESFFGEDAVFKIKKITTTDLMRHLSKRAQGSNSATILDK